MAKTLRLGIAALGTVGAGVLDIPAKHGNYGDSPALSP